MRMPDDAHTKHPWRVQTLAPEFRLLDVWRYPVEIEDRVPLRVFTDFMRAQQQALATGRSPAGLLFRLRGWLGQTFGWDDDDAKTTPQASRPSLRSRLTSEDEARMLEGELDDRDAMGGGFQPVYVFETEVLLEIQNATVHALLHLGRVAIDARHWSPQMGVYVIPRGRLGDFYMALISPFRHGIVYPAMMRAARDGWPRYIEARRREGTAP